MTTQKSIIESFLKQNQNNVFERVQNQQEVTLEPSFSSVTPTNYSVEDSSVEFLQIIELKIDDTSKEEEIYSVHINVSCVIKAEVTVHFYTPDRDKASMGERNFEKEVNKNIDIMCTVKIDSKNSVCLEGVTILNKKIEVCFGNIGLYEDDTDS